MVVCSSGQTIAHKPYGTKVMQSTLLLLRARVDESCHVDSTKALVWMASWIKKVSQMCTGMHLGIMGTAMYLSGCRQTLAVVGVQATLPCMRQGPLGVRASIIPEATDSVYVSVCMVARIGIISIDACNGWLVT